MDVRAYLEITMQIPKGSRTAAAQGHTDYRGPFLEQVESTLTKQLRVRDEDAQAYCESNMLKDDVATGLSPTWLADPASAIHPAMA